MAHPQALVWRDAVGYLLCTLWDYDHPLMQLLLHRMASVEVLDEPRRSMPGFSLDEAIASGAFEFLLAGAPLALEALFEATVAVRVRETPVSASQQLEDQPDGRVLLRASLADTSQLRAWLRSFGEYVEVLGPPELRASMAETARSMAIRYKVGPT